MKGFFLGIVVTLALGLLGAYLFVRGGYLPANADAAPSKLETWAAETSLDATLAHQAPAGPNPVAQTDANLEAGLQVFATNSAVCHGSAAGDTAASAPNRSATEAVTAGTASVTTRESTPSRWDRVSAWNAPIRPSPIKPRRISPSLRTRSGPSRSPSR
jgi:mono/diheme cytochrome c family protein